MSTPAHDGSTLFGRLGGAAAVEAVTADFYARVLDDPLLAPHFDGVDMAVQAGMLAAFLSLAAGGPGEYRGRDLRTAHARLEIGDREFDRVVVLLAAALVAAGAGDSVVAEVAAVAETVRGDVLGRVLQPSRVVFSPAAGTAASPSGPFFPVRSPATAAGLTPPLTRPARPAPPT